MNNIEQNALRIAELMGWNPDSKDNNVYNIIIENRGHDEWLRQPHYAVVKTFSSYNGLMLLVFECNKSKDFYYTRIFINPQDYDMVTIWNYCDSQELSDLVAKFDYNRDSEPEFIQAIQLAVIKYLELKNESRTN